MMNSSLGKTAFAALSRPICGVAKKSLIITLPGSSKGAIENLDAIAGVLGHALELISGVKDAGEAFHKSLHGGHSVPEGGAAADSPQIIHTCTHERHNDSNHHSQNEGPPLSNDPSKSVSKRARHSPYPMITFKDALQTVLDHSILLPSVDLSLNSPQLPFSILSMDVISDEAIPSYRASVVDGYAVYVEDGIGPRPVLSSLTAGASHQFPGMERNSIIRVTTGILFI
jgi:gephyrin